MQNDPSLEQLFLEYLSRSSFGGKMAEAPEIQRIVGLFVNEAIRRHAEAEGKVVDVSELPDSYQPSLGVNPELMSRKACLVPYFGEEHRKILEDVPVGTIYETTLNGFAARVPGSDGCVICICDGLRIILDSVNQILYYILGTDKALEDQQLTIRRFTAYAASKIMHHIDCRDQLRKGQFVVLPPFPTPLLVGDAYYNSDALTISQLLFILAHELSHIAQGHLKAPRTLKGVHRQELEADRNAARVFFLAMKDHGMLSRRSKIESHLGAIASMFYAGQAMYDFSTISDSIPNLYPSPSERFAVVIDYFRLMLNVSDLSADGLLVQPYALVSQISDLWRRRSMEGVNLLLRCAQVCRQMRDAAEDLYMVSLARDLATDADHMTKARELQEYIGANRKTQLPIREPVKH